MFFLPFVFFLFYSHVLAGFKLHHHQEIHHRGVPGGALCAHPPHPRRQAGDRNIDDFDGAQGQRPQERQDVSGPQEEPCWQGMDFYLILLPFVRLYLQSMVDWILLGFELGICDV